MSSAVSRIRDNIVNTIAIYRANIGAIVSGTNQCIHTRIQQGQEQVAGILEQARQCLEGSEETTTPIDDGSETTTPIDDDSATTIRNL